MQYVAVRNPRFKAPREIKHPLLKTAITGFAFVWAMGVIKFNFPPPQRLISEVQRKEFNQFKADCEQQAKKALEDRKLGVWLTSVDFICAEKKYQAAHSDDSQKKEFGGINVITSDLHE